MSNRPPTKEAERRHRERKLNRNGELNQNIKLTEVCFTEYELKTMQKWDAFSTNLYRY